MDEKLPNVIAIAAIGKNRELGFTGGELVWRFSSDLKRFKKFTTGHAVIMGRKTFDSIGKALPERMNIVVTRNRGFVREGYTVAHSIEAAIEAAKNAGVEKIFIGGGGEIYNAALPFTDTLELTLIDAAESRADVFFPPYEDAFQETWRSEPQREGDVNFSWATYTRI